METVDSELPGVWIGTSGWHYSHWRGTFYPPDRPPDRWLAYYSSQFNTVEINNTFYQLPGEETFRQWYAMTPAGFLFAVKASRLITHMKKLSDPQTSTLKFFERVDLLREKLGPILFQLPPHWHPNLERLDTFLKALPAGRPYAFEFRDPSWLEPAVQPALCEVLARHNAALCIYNFGGRTSPKLITANFTYVRLHGPGGPYQGKYSAEDLSGWAMDIAAWHPSGQEASSAIAQSVYCYFDNDMAGFAPQNAQELREKLAGKQGINARQEGG